MIVRFLMLFCTTRVFKKWVLRHFLFVSFECLGNWREKSTWDVKKEIKKSDEDKQVPIAFILEGYCLFNVEFLFIM